MRDNTTKYINDTIIVGDSISIFKEELSKETLEKPWLTEKINKVISEEDGCGGRG